MQAEANMLVTTVCRRPRPAITNHQKQCSLYFVIHRAGNMWLCIICSGGVFGLPVGLREDRIDRAAT
jgi:hypothetical protein